MTISPEQFADFEPPSAPDISGSSGEYSHLVLHWGDETLRVTSDGEIEINGEIIGEPRDIGETLIDWARYMAAHTPAHPSPIVTAPNPGRE